MSNDTERRVRNILLESIEMKELASQIGLDDDLSNLGVNSVIIVKLIVAVENEFGFEFGDDDLDFNKFSTLRSLISYIDEQTRNLNS